MFSVKGSTFVFNLSSTLSSSSESSISSKSSSSSASSNLYYSANQLHSNNKSNSNFYSVIKPSFKNASSTIGDLAIDKSPINDAFLTLKVSKSFDVSIHFLKNILQ